MAANIRYILYLIFVYAMCHSNTLTLNSSRVGDVSKWSVICVMKSIFISVRFHDR